MVEKTPVTIEMLTNIAQPLLPVKSDQPENTEVRIFKYLVYDIDNDGDDEICFAAGRIGQSTVFPGGGAWLLDPAGEAYHTVELVAPRQEGFRDLFVRDVDNDQQAEIFCTWRVGSGAFLSLFALRWDGHMCTSIFPMRKGTPSEHPFYQGSVDIKDIDADGLDEIVVWEGVWANDRAQWAPKHYVIHSFHYTDHGYEFLATYQCPRYYSPGSIVEQSIGIMGMPNRILLRAASVEEYQQRYEVHMREQTINEQFIRELINTQNGLYNEQFHDDALKMADLAIKSCQQLPDSVTRKQFLGHLWYMKALTYLLVGNYQQALDSFQEALLYCTDDTVYPAYTRSDIERQQAFTYARIGDFEHALILLSHAQEQLERDLTTREAQETLARVYSAFAYTYSWLGETSLALESFERAIREDSKLERSFALAINYTGLGNMQRATTTNQYESAINSYEKGLDALKTVSDRQLEADIYLELGVTQMLQARYDESLQNLKLSLLFANEWGLWQQGIRHYLYLGEIYRWTGQLLEARRHYEKVLALTTPLHPLPETKWQALYGLALLSQIEQHPEEAHLAAAEAIEIVEGLRVQYLPEALKVNLLANGKDRLYATMVQLCLEQTESTTEDMAAHFITRALEYVERARSRVFIEELATTSISLSSDLPTALLEQEKHLIDELRLLQLRIQEQAQSQRYEWGKEIEQLETSLAQVWTSIRAFGTAGQEYIDLRQATPISWGRLKAVLCNF